MPSAYLDRTTTDILAALKESRAWLGLAAAIVLLAVGGPFGSYELLGLADRLGMWVLVGLSSFLAGTVIFFALRNLFPVRLARRGWAIVPAALVTSVPVAMVAVIADNLYFGLPIDSERFATDWSNLIVFVLALMALLGLTSSARDGQELREAEETPAETPSPRLIERIRRQLGTELYYVSAQDHYVLVRTSRGRDLILMRFGDAVRDLADYDGLQVHRRHWVARHGVEAIVREGGRTLLVMADGARLPVSRAFLPSLRASRLAAAQ